MKSMAFCVK